jgi:hypothetical protein
MKLEEEPKSVLGKRLYHAKTATKLYVDYYYYVLDFNGYLEFYYDPEHYIKKIPKKEVAPEVIEYLEKNSIVFKNFYKDGEYDETLEADWKVLPPSWYYGEEEEDDFDEEEEEEEILIYPYHQPEIGIMYSFYSFAIIVEKAEDTNKKIMHHHADLDPYMIADFETMGEYELNFFLNSNIFNETQETIKSIYDFDCFKNIQK